MHACMTGKMCGCMCEYLSTVHKCPWDPDTIPKLCTSVRNPCPIDYCYITHSYGSLARNLFVRAILVCTILVRTNLGSTDSTQCLEQGTISLILLRALKSDFDYKINFVLSNMANDSFVCEKKKS